MPERIIESLDLNKAVSCLGIDGDEASWSGFDEYHRAVLQHLEVCGAEVAVIASNTTHHRLRKIVGGIGIPVLSILEAAATQCVQIEARPVLILGTALTMTSLKFRPAFADFGIQAVGPHEDHAVAGWQAARSRRAIGKHRQLCFQRAVHGTSCGVSGLHGVAAGSGCARNSRYL